MLYSLPFGGTFIHDCGMARFPLKKGGVTEENSVVFVPGENIPHCRRVTLAEEMKS